MPMVKPKPELKLYICEAEETRVVKLRTMAYSPEEAEKKMIEGQCLYESADEPTRTLGTLREMPCPKV